MISRYGLKALGLCALLLGAMAVVASGAQAADWDVAGASVGMLEPAVGGELEVGQTAALLATINNLDMELSCTAATLINVKLLLKGTTTSNGTVKFSGCKANVADLNPPGTYNAVKLETLCEPHSKGKPAGIIETREGNGALALHTTAGAKEPVLLFLPSNATLEVVNIEMGEECAFGAEVPVFAAFVLKDSDGKAEVEVAKHRISVLSALNAIRVLDNETGPVATTDGSMLVFLIGTHATKLWRGLAG